MGISNPVPGASLQVFGEQVKWGRRHARDGLLPRHGGEDNWHRAHKEKELIQPPTFKMSPKNSGQPE